MNWNKTEVDPQQVKELARRYGVDLLIATILSRRGITTPQALQFFLEEDVRYLHNPFLVQSMAEAVERIGAAVDSGERILIFGDRDVDGITATVLVYEILKEMEADVLWMLPEGEDTYGLSRKAIEKAVEQGVGLLITVDCGVSNTAEIELAESLGIQTIVVDHHNPPPDLPKAFAIVNPKLDGTSYPFRDLCGCAVASKLEWALRFSRSPFFDEPVCLLNARPANQAVIVEAVSLVNLVETGRVTETIVPGMVPFAKTRLAVFIARAGGSGEALVYGAAEQAALLNSAFAGDAALSIQDIAPLVREFLPSLAGRSLLKLEAGDGRYADKSRTEIDTLKDLFSALVLAREKTRLEPVYKRMDLVTLGTLADLMPLTNENRILVKQGLASLRRHERSGLRRIFLRKDLLGKRFGTTEIAWQIAPLLNSAGRMGEPGTATQLFLSETEEEIEGLVDQLFALDSRRKSMGESTWSLVLDQARESFDHTEGRCVLVLDERIARGITGIIASRLQTFFKAPAVVIAAGPENAVGSIRSAREDFIAEFFGRYSSFFLNFGGHDFAGGFSLERARLEEFLSSFKETVRDMEMPAKKEESLSIDAEIPPAYLTMDLLKVVDFFEPYGEGNPPLAFLTRRARIVHCDLIGRKELNHLKLLFEVGKTRWPAVYWNAAPRLQVDFAVGDTVDVVYRLGRNTYGGGENPQLTVLDIKR